MDALNILSFVLLLYFGLILAGLLMAMVMGFVALVINERKKVLVKFNNVDETIAGTTKKITKGFVIPPVKYIKTANCITS